VPRVDLVVSHYAADLSWVQALRRPGLNVRVYEKGEGPCGLPVQRLPNVGKNDHTYLHHLVEHYHDLADWTLFTPDYPFDHLPGEHSREAGLDLFRRGLVPQTNVTVPWLCQVKDWRDDGRIAWDAFTNRPDRNGTTWADRFASGKIEKAELDFVSWSKRYVGYDPSQGWPGYAAGGVFGAPKAAIRYLPLLFYARLRDQLSKAVEPEEGHYVERLWVAILSGRASYQRNPPQETVQCNHRTAATVTSS
jgi:hypothetical protein